MTAIPDLPPAFYLIGAALLLPFLPAALRTALTVATPVLALGLLLQYESGALMTASFAGFELILLEVTPLNLVFGIIFLLISAVAAIYAAHMKERGQQVAALLYGAGALGVTFAGDFLTLLLYWELMAVTSAWLVFARREAASTAAGFRYLLVHFAGGSILFGGIVLLYGETGSLELGPLSSELGVAAWMILVGVAVNVALPPFHAWLPDAYPKATVTGAIFMSALTTKSAVYVLALLFPGWTLLMYLGLMMTLYGVVYAVLSNDIRQVLAYHIISQVGYMVTGIGIGTELALNGTVAHAYSHILYKALLFMGAGAVVYATGLNKLSELGGLAGKMRATCWLFMIGAFSISGFPLFNGFISKSVIVSAAGKANHDLIMLGLLLASVGTFLSIGLKIAYFAFWGEDKGLKPRPLPANMIVAMSIAAFLCTFYGIAPGFLYDLLPFEMDYHPYTAYHWIEAVQLLSFTFIAFWLMRGKLVGKPYIALDTDWFYRAGRPVADRFVVGPINAFFSSGVAARGAVVRAAERMKRNPRAWFGANAGPADSFEPDRERGPLSSTLAAITVFIVALFVAVSLW